TGISDCKMNEGSLRCDVNLSVRKPGEEFGTRTEMKNLNSFQFIQKAIEFEYKRQIEAIENGEKIIQETRRYDQNDGKTYSMRTKEDANDYRYFPDPDLAPIVTSDAKLAELTAQIPALPDSRKAKYVAEYGLTAYDAELLTNELDMADYFETAAALTEYPKLVANLLISEVFRLMDVESTVPAITAAQLSAMAQMVGAGTINSSVCKTVLKEIWNSDADPVQFVKDHKLEQINDRELLTQLVTEAVEANPKSVADFKKGKTMAAKAIMGQVMKKTGGKCNPVIAQEILDDLLAKA
ncbi:MAG: Asp-tRNA(Asn)/Glu-tRNA(Gln) amidotransferase GatCAB subunit B, partial [Eubacteriales bacterium]